MKPTLSALRPWVVPTLLVCLAGALTVPWTYLVLRAAYNRDIEENARALARRVELQHLINYNGADAAPPDFMTAFREQARRQRMLSALVAEIGSDPSVQSLIFYNLTPQAPTGKDHLAIVRKAETDIKTFNHDDIAALNEKPLIRLNDRVNGNQHFFIPYKRDGRLVGVTYVELSKAALTAEFWKKEAGLLWQVIAWSATGVLALSAVGIFAYRAWERAGHVEHRAELAQQGLLAERGLTAAVLAHEIRNPLQALRFQLHSLRKNFADPTRVTGTAQTIDNELSRIQQLVTDYLEHEKAASTRIQRVDLLDAATTLQTLMDELLRQTDTRLTIVPPPRAVNVVCDPHALRQVLMNLVLNAQQAMGRGGSITIAVNRDEPYGTIDVTDTGPGIPEDMRARLFKPFQTSKREGHGIGLALVKRFVDNFGGSVTVTTETGRGTTFHLKLPLPEADLIRAPEPPLNVSSEPSKIEA